MNTPCIILAGGLGTRLRSEVPDVPKCLAPIGERPFLEWQIQSLSNRGISEFILSLGYGANKVVKFLSAISFRNANMKIIIEDSPLGTGGAVLNAMQSLSLNEVLVANGDTLVCGSIESVLEPLDSSGDELVRVATVLVSDCSRFGSVIANENGIIKSFNEKNHSGSGLINAGLYRIDINAFSHICSSSFSLESEVILPLVDKGLVRSSVISGPFVDIGVPSDYRSLNSNIMHYVT